MRVEEFAYPVARVRALRSFLLGKRDYEAMLMSRSFEDAIVSVAERLRGFPVGAKNPLELDFIMSELAAATHRRVLSFCPKNLKPFFRVYSKREAIKALKALVAGVEGAQGLLVRICPACEELVAKTARKEVIVRTALQDLDLDPGLAETLDPAWRFSLELDRLYYAKLLWMLDKLGGMDKEALFNLLGLEIDCFNVLAVLRCLLVEEEFEDFLLPSRRLNAKELRGVRSKEDLLHRIDREFAAALEPEDLMGCERNLERLQLEEARKAFLGYPFHAGFLLAYLKLKEFELTNVRAVLLGILNDLPREEVRGLLLV